MNAAIRLALLEDHTLVRDGLVALLSGGSGGTRVEVVYAGTDATAAAGAGADVALVDIDLGPERPDVGDNVAVLRAGGTAVLLLSALGDPPEVRAGLDAGALGFVPKRASSDVLLDAVATAAAGEVYLTAELAGILLSGSDIPDLSPREVEALRLYAAGLKVASVARRMDVSPSTAKEYLDRVRAKYSATGRPARTRSELQRVAERDGFLRRPV